METKDFQLLGSNLENPVQSFISAYSKLGSLTGSQGIDRNQYRLFWLSPLNSNRWHLFFLQLHLQRKASFFDKSHLDEWHFSLDISILIDYPIEMPSNHEYDLMYIPDFCERIFLKER